MSNAIVKQISDLIVHDVTLLALVADLFLGQQNMHVIKQSGLVVAGKALLAVYFYIVDILGLAYYALLLCRHVSYYALSVVNVRAF